MANFNSYKVLTADGREFEVTARNKEQAREKVMLTTQMRAKITEVTEVQNG